VAQNFAARSRAEEDRFGKRKPRVPASADGFQQLTPGRRLPSRVSVRALPADQSPARCWVFCPATSSHSGTGADSFLLRALSDHRQGWPPEGGLRRPGVWECPDLSGAGSKSTTTGLRSDCASQSQAPAVFPIVARPGRCTCEGPESDPFVFNAK